MRKSIAQFVIPICVAIFGSSSAQAYQFEPTDAEWAGWPGYCQAKYVWTNIGKTSKYVNSVSHAKKAQLSEWEVAGVRGVHHYCAGTLWLQRARLERNPRDRDYMLNEGQRETQFSLGSSNRSAPQYANVAVQMASILYEQGETTAALETVQNLIPVQPSNNILYSATAYMLRKLNRLDKAKDVLVQGDIATDGSSAEIQYNLGLVLIELGELDDAEAYAVSAYEKGYPLPGLRTKLRKLDRMK